MYILFDSSYYFFSGTCCTVHSRMSYSTFNVNVNDVMTTNKTTTSLSIGSDKPNKLDRITHILTIGGYFIHMSEGRGIKAIAYINYKSYMLSGIIDYYRVFRISFILPDVCHFNLSMPSLGHGLLSTCTGWFT